MVCDTSSHQLLLVTVSDFIAQHIVHEICLLNWPDTGILVLTYPPHTSNLFQVLDLLLVGRLKSAKKTSEKKIKNRLQSITSFRSSKPMKRFLRAPWFGVVGRTPDLPTCKMTESSIYSWMMAKSEIHLNFRKFGALIIPWKIHRLGEGGISKRRVLRGKILWDAGRDDP
jgi:hypothetical protein